MFSDLPFYHHNLDPFLIGPYVVGPIRNFGIRWYSLAYILGFLAIYASLYRAVIRRRIPNGDLERLEEACLILIAAVILGGRLGYFILIEPHKLLTLQGWLEVPQVWRGGMAFFGAALTVFVTEYWYCRKNRVGFWHGADRLVWVLAFALGFGRIANFINGELYGIPTDGQWGVYFPGAPLVNGLNVPRHPVQLYSAVSHWLLGFFLLYLLKRRPRSRFDRIPGFTVFWFLSGYGLLRFVTDFWRHEATDFGLINGGQVLSLVLVVVGLVAARVRYVAFTKHASEVDWYPPEGVEGELPAEAHAFVDAVVADRKASDEAARQRRETARAKRRRKK